MSRVQNWLSDHLCAQLQGGESNPEPIDLKLNSVKPLPAIGSTMDD